MAPAQTLRLGDVLLDPGAGCLRGSDGAEIALRPKSFDLLAVLARNPRRTLSRNELLDAVWPGVTVTDESVTQCVREVRRAIGDPDGRLLRTVARRGYRLDLEVAPATLADRGLVPTETKPVSAPDLRVGNKRRLSIVVLPFANLSNDAEQQYLADGITEDLTTDLTRLGDMFVISCNTAFTYRNKRVGTKRIGHELGVRYVLEGSIRRSGDRVRVSAQLIDATSDTHLWAERFEGDTGGLLTLQEEITGRIAVALSLELIDAEAARPTECPDAQDCIFRARAALSKPSSYLTYMEGIRLLERAVSLDPQSEEAQSRLACVLTGRVLDGLADSPAADIAFAERLVEQTLATSPRNSLAHFAKGQVLRAQHRNEEAILEFEMAIASNHNWPIAYAQLGRCKFYTGSIEEMIPLVMKAIHLSPRDGEIGQWFFRIGVVHLVQSRIAEAIVWLEKARNAMPAHPLPHAHLASAYALNGDTNAAAGKLADARRFSSDQRYSSIALLRTIGYFGVPKIHALYEVTYFAGLRKAGMPDE